MSCSSCGSCSPCACETSCDATNEPLSSALINFEKAFLGTVTKTCVNNEVVWLLPCDLEAGVTGFPRNAGEGVACYLLRIWQTINVGACQDFRHIFCNGVCYDTWQAAYDANSGATSKTLMLVGSGSFGDLNITTAYNSNIVIFGLGEGSSLLGTMNTNRTDLVMEAHHVTFTSINTVFSTIGGAIITLTGGATVGTILNNRTDAGAGSVQGITITGWTIGSINNSYAVGGGASGNVELTDCTCGTINVSSVGSSTGATRLHQCRSIGSIVNTGSTTGGEVRAEETNIISGAGLNAISSIENGSSFINCKIKTIDTNKDAIAEVTVNNAQFLNTIIVPHGTGLPITASVARTIIAYNLLLKNDLGPNVTLSEGNYLFSPNIRYP